MEATKSKRPVMAAIGCALILALGIGSTSLMNAIAPLLIEGMNTTLTDYSFGPMLATLLAFAVSLIGAKIIIKIGARRCLLIGTICVTVVLCLIGSATSTVLWYIASIINGAVLAIGAHAAVAGVLSEFYGERTPTVFGIVVGVMSFLVAAEVLIESIMLTAMDYRTITFIFAGIVLVVGLFSNFVLIGKLPSERVGKNTSGTLEETEAQNEEQPLVQNEQEESGQKNVTGFTLKEALRSPALYLFFLAMVLASFPLNGYSAYASYFFVGNGMTAAFAAMLMSVFGIFVAIISLFSGAVSKKIGASISSVIVFLGFAVGVFLMVIWANNGGNALVYSSLLFCALIGPVQILPALFIPQIFGMKDYTSINAVGMAGFYLGGSAVFLVVAAIMQSIGYNMGFITLAICGVAALILFILAIACSPMRVLKKQENMKSEAVHKDA